MNVLVIKNNADTPPSLVGDHLIAAGVQLTTVLPHGGGSLPATTEGFDGAVILGGPQHAGDDTNYPAFPPMLDLLRDFHDQEKPLLGLCLGANCWRAAAAVSVPSHNGRTSETTASARLMATGDYVPRPHSAQ